MPLSLRAYEAVQQTFQAPETEDAQAQRLLEWCQFLWHSIALYRF
jgi:hypothetical protein